MPTREKLKSFSPDPIRDAMQNTGVLPCLTHDTREAVDELVKKAIAAGGKTYKEPQDHGFMYGHGFQDPDGHVWELIPEIRPAPAEYRDERHA
jgi:predicted lactoylglutathione lyase